MKNRKLLKYLIIILILSIPSIISLLRFGFFTTDDGNWMVIRFSAFYEALRNGQFPVRFLPRLNNGYGYPVANFLYPLFMYLGVPIHVLGFSFVNTIKVIFGLSLVSSSFFAFLWLRKKFDEVSSLIGSLIYLYFPYHLWDVYKRGSIGEILALSIVPFVLWQIERKSLFWVSLGVAFLILAHNTLSLLFLPVVFIYALLIKKTNLWKKISPFIIGIGLSTFYWLPALYERKFVIFDKISVSDFSSYFINLQNVDLIGLVFLVAFLVTFFILKKIKGRIYWLFFITSIISIFLVLPASGFIWQVIAPYIQFPFRLISLLILTTTFLVSYQLNFLKGKVRKILIVIYLILLIFGVKNFITPKEFTNYPDSFYSTNVDTTTVKKEYMPKWVKEIPLSLPKDKVQIAEGKADVSSLVNNGNKISFNLNAKEQSLVSVNTVYYPGWEVKIDNGKAKINYENSGLVQFYVSPGRHSAQVYFTETPLRFFADAISVFFILLLLLFLIIPCFL